MIRFRTSTRPRRLAAGLLTWLFAFAGVCLLTEPATAADRRWSANLLDAVLKEPPGDTAKGQAAGGHILRSYQLRTVRVGEAGRSGTLLQTMERLLPEGSSLKADPRSNTLHILTTPAAHEAVWDFISAVDAPLATSQAAPGGDAHPRAELTPEVREALARLAESSRKTQDVAAALERLRAEVEDGRRETAARGRWERAWPPAIAASAALLALLAGVAVVRRHARRTPTPAASVGAVEIASEQITLALAPVHDRLEREMVGVINAAAIRMESWYNEQQAQREKMSAALAAAGAGVVAANEAFLKRAEDRFAASAARLEANVGQLAQQNTRVEALAGELEDTVRELDETKDGLARLQGELDRRTQLLDTARSRLSQREGELERQHAKLAALTLILEEGGAGALDCAAPAAPAPERGSTDRSPTQEIPCQTTPEAQPCTPTPPKVRFRFLPPEHPET